MAEVGHTLYYNVLSTGGQWHATMTAPLNSVSHGMAAFVWVKTHIIIQFPCKLWSYKQICCKAKWVQQ